MSENLDERLGRLAARWVAFVLPRWRVVLAAITVASLVLGAIAWRGLAVDSDEDALFADDVPFAQLRQEWNQLFPRFIDPIVVVVDAPSDDAAHAATQALAARVAADSAHFERVRQPGAGPFFERHGLLYLEPEALEDLADRLATAQPFLARLSREPSGAELVSLLDEAVTATERGDLAGEGLAEALGRVGDVVASHARGDSVPLSWSAWILRDAAPTDHRRFLIVQPRFDFTRIDPAGASIRALRATIRELGLAPGTDGAARARLTGVYVFALDESEHVREQATWAGVASFVLVSLVLVFGLGSARAVLAALAALVVSLAWTAGFAALAVGHLNLVSVAFAVLVIGLGIDFGVHLCVHALALLGHGLSRAASVRGAVRDVGGSLAICAATTAFAFYAFAPTQYRGVAELGLIAGTSMFFSLFASLTLLPILLARWGPVTVRAPGSHPWLTRLLDIPVRHAGLVLAATAVAVAAAVASLGRVEFDVNPLRVRDPMTESVQTFNDLLAAGQAFPWNLNARAPDAAAAADLARRLGDLPGVDRAVTLADFVPDAQHEKLAILADVRLLLEPALAADGAASSDPAKLRSTLVRLQATLAHDASDLTPGTRRAAGRLRDAVAAFLAAHPPGEPAAAAALGALDRALTGSLPEQLRLLREALRAGPVTLDTLPSEIRDAWVATDGSVRVEVHPAEDLNDNTLLAAYVDEVRSVAPDAFGEGLVILESGRVVVRALRQALLVAGTGILLLLVLLWRNLRHAALTALPLGLAALFTAASTVWLGVPLNFANVIVIPLLLGMGVDSSIHLVHRLRAGRPRGGNLLHTSTARAVSLSALTTVASFGTLALSSHPGLASLGRLLALGLGMVLLANLVVLPAVAATWHARTAFGGAGGADRPPDAPEAEAASPCPESEIRRSSRGASGP